jgi:hypothetical protein
MSEEQNYSDNNRYDNDTAMTASVDVGTVDWRPELVWVSGGMPFLSENDGQVSLVFPVESAGQQLPSPTLPSAAASFHPAQFWQVTVSYEIFQTPKSV